ncbi:hypothetical protein BV25DRAFT_1922248 [Artomyces pyxidatus]|uniref:Uncharacterized protein n=1 Tax=Artomyces pyxidatus TaxID=48021 RepID=A0ACB8SEM0_9AGAM|nr:hypothetical protein BV25DRAFT_1922248 [Artomyces pyxidatus]
MSPFDITFESLGRCMLSECAPICPQYYPTDRRAAEDLALLPDVLCKACSHAAYMHRKPQAAPEPVAPQASKKPDLREDGGIPPGTKSHLHEVRPGPASSTHGPRPTSSFATHAQRRSEKAGGSNTFQPAAKSHKDTLDARGPADIGQKRKRPTAQPSTSKPTTKTKPPPKPVVFSVVFIDRTDRVHRGEYLKPIPQQLNELVLSKLVKTIEVPKDADYIAVDYLIRHAFDHIAVFLEANDLVLASRDHFRAWTPLIVRIQGQGHKSFLFPYSATERVAYDDLKYFTTGTKIQSAPAYKSILFIALIDLHPLVPSSATPRNFNIPLWSDNHGARPTTPIPDDIEAVQNDEQEATQQSDGHSESAHSFPDAAANSSDDQSHTPYHKTDPFTRYTTLNDPEPAGFSPPRFSPSDAGFASYPDTSSGSSSERKQDAAMEDLPPPPSHTSIERAMYNISAPGQDDIQKGNCSWWAGEGDVRYAPLYEAYIILRHACDRWATRQEGGVHAAEALWADYGDDFLRLLTFRPSLSDSETDSEDEFLPFLVGPKGINFVIKGLGRLYEVTAAFPRDARWARDVKWKLLVYHSNIIELHYAAFVSITSRLLYDPPNFRAVERLLSKEENALSKKFALATQDDWTSMSLPFINLASQSPAELHSLLVQDFGSADDHLKMKNDRYILSGEWGLSGLMSKIILPFLDSYPISSPNYQEFFDVFDTFLAALNQKLVNYLKTYKSKGKARAEPMGRKAGTDQADIPSSNAREHKYGTRSSGPAGEKGTQTKNSAPSPAASPSPPLFSPGSDSDEAELREQMKSHKPWEYDAGGAPSQPIVISDDDDGHPPKPCGSKPKPRPSWKGKQRQASPSPPPPSPPSPPPAAPAPEHVPAAPPIPTQIINQVEINRANRAVAFKTWHTMASYVLTAVPHRDPGRAVAIADIPAFSQRPIKLQRAQLLNLYHPDKNGTLGEPWLKVCTIIMTVINRFNKEGVLMSRADEV